MQYKLLGRSGLRVSELCLGCATFGTNWGSIGSDRRESRRIFDAFAEAGGNFIDTSNRYQEGQSEEFLGEFLERERDRFVVATKYSLGDGGTPGTDPNGCGNHRKNMMRSVEGSLQRLGTDYIDLLWVHIWDYTTPIEEIMRGLDDLVRQGKVHYVGASNFPAWWLSRANTLAEFHGWSPLVATQVEYAITERSCEPEFLPFAHEMDVALVCWSPLGGGICSGKYNRPGGKAKLQRLADEVDPGKRHFWHEITKRNVRIMDGVVAVADRIGRTPAQVSLRWLMQQKVVCVPIFSARTLEQAKEDLGAVDFVLSDDDMRLLTQASQAAVQSIMPGAGPYPWPMLEYGSPALPEFYSRFLLFGQTEYKIINHRRLAPFQYQPKMNGTRPVVPIDVTPTASELITV
jgi:aryl-alcohol dehydrogenase-like predicted oxidoreductase